MQEMLVPLPWQGINSEIVHNEVQWLKKLSNAWCALWQRWPQQNLPLGYNLYVVSFHLEAVDISWLEKQCQRLEAPIILLSDSNYYDWPLPKNLYAYTYYYWHNQLDKILSWFPQEPKKAIKYKCSSICNRMTQSKILVTTKILESMPGENLVKLSDWVEDKNIHHRGSTGRPKIDNIMEIFYKKYQGTTLEFDKFNNEKDNYQFITSDPLNPALQNSALMFTNESFHYSYYQDHGRKYVHPGPFLTEKTFKCLVGQVGFVAVGQFDTYGTLARLGFRFDYDFDISWDKTVGDLDRLENILDLIDYLSKFEANEIFDMTADSARYNREHVISGDFRKLCLSKNYQTETTILSKFSH